jgi:hypothetical protein
MEYNGPHTIFAVAQNTTVAPATEVNADVRNAFAASPIVSVIFSNYVSRFYFSEPFFEPELGETQNISAVFAANSDWTLTITDPSGATNRTVSGTGATMNFAWDGKGNGGVTLSNDAYDFTLTASAASLLASSTGGTATSPLTKAKKVKGKVGTVGIAWQGHHPDNCPVSSYHAPANAPFFPSISISGNCMPYPKLNPFAANLANNFAKRMSKSGWGTAVKLGDDDLVAAHLRKPSKGGSNIFNQVNIGLLTLHGTRGLNGDFTISGDGPLQSYMPIWKTGATDYDWVRISECDFGSSNLHWMAIAACNILDDTIYQDMYDKLALPINDDLHLLLGARTVLFIDPNLGEIWAKYMLGGWFGLVPAKTVEEAWFLAGHQTQQWGGTATNVTFRVAGWGNCFADKLRSFENPNSGNPADITYVDEQVSP